MWSGGDPAERVAGRATVWYVGDWSSSVVMVVIIPASRAQTETSPSVEPSYCFANHETSAMISVARDPGMSSLMTGTSGQI